MKSSSSKLEGSRSCRPKTRWPGENPARSTRRLSSANVEVDQLIYFILRSRGFQTARFLECHFEQGSMSLDDGILPRRFQISHYRQDPLDWHRC